MNITVSDGGKEIAWDWNGSTVKKKYSDILMGYEVLPDKAGIILLEPASQVGTENAVIYNIDGTQQWRLQFPSGVGVGLLFDRVGVSSGDLVVIGAMNGRDVKFTIDYNNSKYYDISPTV